MRAASIKALNDAEKRAQPHVRHLFTDVLDEPPWMLRQQQAHLKAHLAKYSEHYAEVTAEQIDSM